jgi:thymidylate synthase (FAD)
LSAQTLKITRVAEPMLSISEASKLPAMLAFMELDDDATAADALAEFSGRACYQSWHKPNPDTATNKGYTAHVLDVEHLSLFGHASVSYYIEGVSRSLTHELVRHRFPTFSQLSQRYVKLGSDLPYVVPPLCEGDHDAEVLLRGAAEAALDYYERLLAHLDHRYEGSNKVSSKQIREAARAVLPNMTETKIVVSASLRAWRDLLAQRLPETADAEIRRLAQALLVDLRKLAPNSFQDIEDHERVSA